MDKFVFGNVLIDAFNEYNKSGEYYIDTPGMQLSFRLNPDTFTMDTTCYILIVQFYIALADDAELVKEFWVKWDELGNPQGLVAHCKQLFDDAVKRYKKEMSKLYEELNCQIPPTLKGSGL